jgi:hypothetical protein
MSETKEKIKVTRISLKEFEEIEKRSSRDSPSEKWDKILQEVQRGRALKVEGLSRGEILTLIRYIKQKHLPVRHVCFLKESVIYLAPSAVKKVEEKAKEEKEKEVRKTKKSTKKAEEKEIKEALMKVEPTT